MGTDSDAEVRPRVRYLLVVPGRAEVATGLALRSGELVAA